MDRGHFSISTDGLIPSEPFYPTTRQIKKPTKTKLQRPRVNREPLATGKALPRYHLMLLDSEAFLAQLCRCRQIRCALRCAQTSRRRPGHLYLPQISYLKTAEAQPLMSAQTTLKKKTQHHSEHPKWLNPTESHNSGTTNSVCLINATGGGINSESSKLISICFYLQIFFLKRKKNIPDNNWDASKYSTDCTCKILLVCTTLRSQARANHRNKESRL